MSQHSDQAITDIVRGCLDRAGPPIIDAAPMTDEAIGGLRLQLEAYGCFVGIVDSGAPEDRPLSKELQLALLDRIGEAFDFPDYYGRNWDALEDLLADLDRLGASCLFLVVRHSLPLMQNDEWVFKTLSDICTDTAQLYKRTGKVFKLVLA